jgi:hypothetical protein
MLDDYLMVDEGHAIAQAVSFGQACIDLDLNEGVHVRFVVEKVALGYVFVGALVFSPAIVFPPMLHLHISFNTDII